MGCAPICITMLGRFFRGLFGNGSGPPTNFITRFEINGVWPIDSIRTEEWSIFGKATYAMIPRAQSNVTGRYQSSGAFVLHAQATDIKVEVDTVRWYQCCCPCPSCGKSQAEYRPLNLERLAYKDTYVHRCTVCGFEGWTGWQVIPDEPPMNIFTRFLNWLGSV